MVRLLLIIALWLAPAMASAQSREVAPEELSLTITLEERDATPHTREMLLLTIHGIYKRHITLEKLVQPSLEGLNWMQLGQDDWFESQLDGKTVKNMRRRMAIFPETSGRIEIGPFKHHLTLLDENNKWFEHTIQSDPVSFDVTPAPQTDAWWFPVRGLKIADDWSNAPDQLAQGEGVLRVIRLSALGASPDMIPPMPELRSPSALIFAHPEKRLVDLTPSGPVSIAFWRWTIQPRNGVSAILEPVEFEYFDTNLRETIQVSISAQRIAYSPGQAAVAAIPGTPAPALLRSGLMVGTALLSFLVAFGVLFGSQNRLSGAKISSWLRRRKLLNGLRRSSQTGDLAGLRRAAYQLNDLAVPDARRPALLAALDDEIYGRGDAGFDSTQFFRQFTNGLKIAE